MEDWERDPEHAEREEADHAAEGVGEDHAAARAGAFGGAGVFFVEDFVEAVEHAADADDEVADEAVLRFFDGLAAVGGSAAGGAAVRARGFGVG